MNKIWSLHSPSSGGIINRQWQRLCLGYKGRKQHGGRTDIFSSINIKLGFLPWFPTHKLCFLLWIARVDQRISVWFFWVENVSITDLTIQDRPALWNIQLTEKSFIPASIIDFVLFHREIWNSVFTFSCVHYTLYNIL